ncbi:MAG: glutamate synthase-related protein [Bacillota bacterium]|nr:glutamate synthase-related protein [Bacillota bacterium]
MTYSPGLTSGYARTAMRSKYTSPQSGMCSMCTMDCQNQCEIGMAAVLGPQTVYPTTTGNNQIASEKDYPVNYSHFNINGRVFGAKGLKEGKIPAIYNVELENEYGYHNPVKIKMPIMLPALIKLNWKDYFGGAAMAGVPCVVGENAVYKDEGLILENGKAVEAPLLGEIRNSFMDYYRGYGQIILQCNLEDMKLGIDKIGLQKYGFDAIEIKFGQAAKGIQPAIKLGSLEEALEKKKLGLDVYPDPEDERIAELYSSGKGSHFFSFNELPMWTEEKLEKKIGDLRNMGAKNIYFKMAGYDREDIETVLRFASKFKVDMVTIDGAGGGSGYSPCKMMNEWGLPAICIEPVIESVVNSLRSADEYVPFISLTGGFASEDQLFKALALGNGAVNCIGVCRAAMAAAMQGKQIGDRIKANEIPTEYKKYGDTVDSIFAEMNEVKGLYGSDKEISTGAVGVYSYLNKLAFGLQHLAALNRKFNIRLLNKDDLIPMTEKAVELIGG